VRLVLDRSEHADTLSQISGAAKISIQRLTGNTVSRVLGRPEIGRACSSVEHASREVGISVATLERWRADALANGSGTVFWHATPWGHPPCTLCVKEPVDPDQSGR